MLKVTQRALRLPQRAALAKSGRRRQRSSKTMSSASSEPESFKLGENTTLNLSVGDITDWQGDAIVNAANERMLGGGGVDGAIHRAAGPELRQLCQEVPTVSPNVRCPTGEARITGAAELPVKYVIHTVGPVYDAQPPEEAAELLGSAYRNSLKLANENNCKSVAFPAISCGVFGYPYKEAAEVAFQACKDHAGDLTQIDFVFFSKPTYQPFLELAQSRFQD